MTAAETILQAIATCLTTAATGALAIERSRVVPFDLDQLPAIVFRPKSEESTPLGSGLLRCVLSVEVEIHTRGNQPDQLADPVAELVDATIRRSPAILSLISRVFRSAKEWDLSDSDGTGGKLVLIYQFHYAEPA